VLLERRLENDLVEAAGRSHCNKIADVAGDTLSNSAVAQTTQIAPPAGARSSTRSAKSSTFGLTFPPRAPDFQSSHDSPRLARTGSAENASSSSATRPRTWKKYFTIRRTPTISQRSASRDTSVREAVEPVTCSFRADAEDEFKVLDEVGGWVHVQVSESRADGFGGRDLELPGEAIAAADTTKQPATLPNQKRTKRRHCSRRMDCVTWTDGSIAWVEPASDGVQGAMDRCNWPIGVSRHLRPHQPKQYES